MVKLKCQRCGYEWEYKGKSEWYAPCSRCKTSINIKKQIENRKKKKKGDDVDWEIGEMKEHLTPAKKKDVPTLNLSIVRGI